MKARASFLIGVAAALSAQLVTAAPNCSFKATGTLSISFGNLDPSLGTTVSAAMTVGTVGADEVGNCTPATQTMTLSAGNGLNFSGGSRQLASGGNFIPYSLGAAASAWTGSSAGPWTQNKPGNNRWVPIPSLSAVILGVNYQNAAPGTYTDTVVLTISP
jgi:spore coat protein U-like protein